MFGIFEHHINVQGLPIFRGFDDVFCASQPSHRSASGDILKVKDLTLLSESDDSGVYMAMARNGREFFITGHSEYSPYTLDTDINAIWEKGFPLKCRRTIIEKTMRTMRHWFAGADMPTCCSPIG